MIWIKNMSLFISKGTHQNLSIKVKNVTRFSSKGTCQILQKKDKLLVDQPFDLFFRK